MSVLRPLLLPVWIAQIFTTAKSFRDNPVLGSPLLNRLGLHVARVRLAHAVMSFRSWLLSPLVSAEHRRQYEQRGYIEIRNFLDAEHFEGLRREIEACRAPVRECIQGDTLTLRVLLDEPTLAGLPNCRKLAEHRDLLSLLRYCGGTLRRPMMYLQSIKSRYVGGGDDPQKSLHSDTFHPTMKAWLFMEDIAPGKGPLTYVPGSHRPTSARLDWERRQSLAAAAQSNRYAAKGSLRLTDKDLADMGLPAPVAFTVPANTLVIANTHGFHCRGNVDGKCSRLEVYASSRTNPFLPLPGLGTRTFQRLENAVAQAYWSHMDRQAARRGYLSSWHPVPSEKLMQ